jgi:hypothetical protein
MPEKIKRTRPPSWMKSLDRFPGRMSGAAASDIVDCYELSREAFGEPEDENSGLVAFAYLWRRFGPPPFGSDDHKELCCYYLGTPVCGAVLSVSPRGSGLSYGMGYMISNEIRDECDKPRRERFAAMDRWAKDNGYEDGMSLMLLEENREAYQRAMEAVGQPPVHHDLRKWREIEGPVGKLNKALYRAMRELLRPVFVRDVSINILGRCEPWRVNANPSRFAGMGIDLDAVLKNASKED